MIRRIFHLLARKQTPPTGATLAPISGPRPPLGLIAGNGPFPIEFADAARLRGERVVAVCHLNETDPALAEHVDAIEWIKVGELGHLISVFKQHGVKQAAMAGGISRVRAFSDVKLDLRGAALLARIRSTKDDIIMRGIADELLTEGIEVVSCTSFSPELLIGSGILGRSRPSAKEMDDIEVGRSAIRAMSGQDIGQVVVVKEGVVVAVEAVEGTDAAIKRGGELGGPGCVVVKFAKTTQDMRFDVPTVGLRTIETMREVKARVLALEAGRCMVMNRNGVIELADQEGIAIIGCEPLVNAPAELSEPVECFRPEPTRFSR